MITVNLSEAEAEAVLRVLSPYCARWTDTNAETAAAKIDNALLAHEENQATRQ